jgi:hypothetical protein
MEIGARPPQTGGLGQQIRPSRHESGAVLRAEPGLIEGSEYWAHLLRFNTRGQYINRWLYRRLSRIIACLTRSSSVVHIGTTAGRQKTGDSRA